MMMPKPQPPAKERRTLDIRARRRRRQQIRYSCILPLISLLAGLDGIEGRAALPPQHSKAFPLRYECDVAPALAGWSLAPGSTSPGIAALNGWVSFTSSVPQMSVYRNSRWIAGSGQAFTVEIRCRTPQRGQFKLIVDDSAVSQAALTLSSTGLLWNISGVPTLISASASNAMQTVRVAAWTMDNDRFVQVWQDGRSVLGPILDSTPSSVSGAATLWGDVSSTGEAALEIDYIRMAVGTAYAPFLPQLSASKIQGSISLTWPLAQRAVYQLAVTHDLAASLWMDLGPRIPGLGGTASYSEPMAGVARFYRVKEIVEGAIDQPWSPAAAGPPPICMELPAFNCTANCQDLVPFTPELGPGYENYPANGETAADQYRSYIRRDVRQAIQYAAARVECQAGHWPFGNNQRLGLGDMSEANGSIPGTRDGAPSHPIGTHQDGKDIDVAYYQLDTTNNHPRAICESQIGGIEQFHCVAPPNILDPWRTAFFAGILLQHPRLRVIGVDGQVGPVLLQAINQLAAAGWLPATVPSLAQQKLAFETSDQGRGWYYFHHQYMHISFTD